MKEQELLQLYRVFYALGDRQSLQILHVLDVHGEQSFTQIRTLLAINPTSLTKRLKLLRDMQLVVADRSHDKLHVYYSLHNHSRSVKKILDIMRRIADDL